MSCPALFTKQSRSTASATVVKRSTPPSALVHALAPQAVAHRRARLDDLQRDPAASSSPASSPSVCAPCMSTYGRGGEVEHDESRAARHRSRPVADRSFAHVVDVEVEQAPTPAGRPARPGSARCRDGARESEKRRVPGMRPSTATCGREARRISCTSEMTAPISTPRSRPEPSTPSSAAIATTNSVRSARQQLLQRRELEQAGHRHQHDRREHRLRQARSSCEKKSTTTRIDGRPRSSPTAACARRRPR